MIFIVFNINLFGQEKKININDCFATLKKYTRNIQVNIAPLYKLNMSLKEKQSIRVPNATTEIRSKLDEMSKNEVMNLARIINNAVLENPIEFEKLMIEDDVEVKKEIKNGRRDLISMYIFKAMLRHKMKTLINPKISEFLIIPLVLKVKINQINQVIYNTKDSISFALSKIEIKCIVSDVIKGSNLFKKDDLVEFYYMGFWKNTNREFIEGEEYFVSLDIRIQEDEPYSLALVTFKGTDGIYAIKENKLIDETNYFDLGVNMEWRDFKAKFIKHYIHF